jgi:hypothetical protein
MVRRRDGADAAKLMKVLRKRDGSEEKSKEKAISCLEFVAFAPKQ